MSLLLNNKRRKTQSINPDPYWNNVVLFLKGDGTNGSTNIVDSSPSPKTVTRNGGITISTAQSKYGGSSILFDGADDFLSFVYNAGFQFNGQFTIEGWLYCNNTDVFSTIFEIGIYPNTLLFRQEGTTGGNLYIFTNNTIKNFSDELNGNIWRHFAITRDSSDLVRLFIDGILYNSTTQSGYINSDNNGMYIGQSIHSGGQFWQGYLDSFRITKGVCRYTSTFNVETDTYLS
jgi:hypothetical protein